MRPALLLAGASWAGLAGAAAAQEPCAGLWALVEGWGQAGLGAPATAQAVGPAEDGWCEAAGVRVALGGGSMVPTILADRLRWRGEELEAVLAGTGLPVAIELEAEGLRQVTVTGEPVLDWAFEAQARPQGSAARLAARWDREARAVEVTALSLDLPGDNGLEATARLEGVDLSTPGAAVTSLGSLSLARLDASVESNGLFEAYLLVPLASAVLVDAPSPEAGWAAWRRSALDAVAVMPDALAPAVTRAELKALLLELPNPAGRLDVAVDAQQGRGLGVARFALMGVPDTPAALWAALDGLRLTVDWIPSTGGAGD